MKTQNPLLVKIGLIAALTLLLLIPLAMVKKQIRERQDTYDESIREVASSWGLAQTLTGPSLQITCTSVTKDADGKPLRTQSGEILYPATLSIDLSADTQELHRSIYTIPVYKADVRMTGSFVLPARLLEEDVTGQVMLLGVSDLKGIEGSVSMNLGSDEYTFSETEITERNDEFFRRAPSALIKEKTALGKDVMDGTTEISFTIHYKIRGSSELRVRPYGDNTTVRMQSGAANPSFVGDFLPSEREVREDGFSATWEVSKVNRGKPDDCSFGVKLLQSVTQYQQSTRTAKYGILVILLVFIAGLLVEFLTGKQINIVQYVVIGLSLVLFYALELAFSEFMPFAAAYAVAALMTVAALTGYFRAILHNTSAWLLGGLTAVAYLLSYILLQMETYAFLTGTLLLFVLLLVVMFFTRSMGQAVEDK